MCYVRSASACKIILAKFSRIFGKWWVRRSEEAKQKINSHVCSGCSGSVSVRRGSCNIYGELLGPENTFTMS